MRIKYKLSTNELESLVGGLMQNGPDKMLELMKIKVGEAILQVEDMDQNLMDMYDEVVVLARDLNEEESEDIKSIKSVYYLLSQMLRKLAQDAHMAYVKLGKNKDDVRFLKLVHHNKDVHQTLGAKE